MDPAARLSIASTELDWVVEEVFTSRSLRLHRLRCRPYSLGCSCEKYAVEHQFVFVLAGGFVRQSADGPQVANAGKVMFFRAGEPYRTTHFSSDGDDCLVVSIRGDWAALPGTGAVAMAAPAALAGFLRLVRRVRAGCLSASAAEAEALPMVASIMGRGMLRLGAIPALVGAVEVRLSSAPGEDWSLAALAQQFGRSPTHLTRSFRHTFGVPLHQYLLRLRLAHAAARLSEGERDLSVLAHELGFSSHAHFSAAFRAWIGAAPSAFRDETRWRPTGLSEGISEPR